MKKIIKIEPFLSVIISDKKSSVTIISNKILYEDGDYGFSVEKRFKEVQAHPPGSEIGYKISQTIH